VHSDQFGAVRKSRLDLDIGIISGTPSITSSRLSKVPPQLMSSDTLRPSRAPSMIAAVMKPPLPGSELDPARFAPLGEQGCREYQQFVLLARRQFHSCAPDARLARFDSAYHRAQKAPQLREVALRGLARRAE